MPFDDEEEPYRVLKTGFYDRDMNPYTLEIRTSTVEKDDLLFNLVYCLRSTLCSVSTLDVPYQSISNQQNMETF